MNLGTLTKLMRNIFLVLIILGLTQCTKDSTSGVSIVGKWQLQSSTYKRYTNGLITKTGSDDIKLVGYTLEFKNDGTAVATDNGGGIEYYKYKITGSLISITSNNIPILGSNSIPFILSSTKLEWTYFSQGTKDNGTEVTEILNRIN